MLIVLSEETTGHAIYKADMCAVAENKMWLDFGWTSSHFGLCFSFKLSSCQHAVEFKEWLTLHSTFGTVLRTVALSLTCATRQKGTARTSKQMSKYCSWSWVLVEVGSSSLATEWLERLLERAKWAGCILKNDHPALPLRCQNDWLAMRLSPNGFISPRLQFGEVHTHTKTPTSEHTPTHFQ